MRRLLTTVLMLALASCASVPSAPFPTCYAGCEVGAEQRIDPYARLSAPARAAMHAQRAHTAQPATFASAPALSPAQRANVLQAALEKDWARDMMSRQRLVQRSEPRGALVPRGSCEHVYRTCTRAHYLRSPARPTERRWPRYSPRRGVLCDPHQ